MTFSGRSSQRHVRAKKHLDSSLKIFLDEFQFPLMSDSKTLQTYRRVGLAFSLPLLFLIKRELNDGEITFQDTALENMIYAGSES